MLADLQALAARLASPFNRTLMALELARQLPPDQAGLELAGLLHSPVVQQRPGLQLHATVLLAQAAQQAGSSAAALGHAQSARALQAQCAPFDMSPAEADALLLAVAGP